MAPQGPFSLRGLTYQEAVARQQQIDAGRNYQGFIDTLGDVNLVLSMAGSVTQAIGNFYAVKAQQDDLKAQALSMDFAAQVAEFNKNLAEQEVARVQEARQQQVGLLRMRTAEEKASARASAAGRGVKIDSGSAAETERAIELMSQIDAMTIEANFEQQARNVERGATEQGNRALLTRASAKNIRSTAKSLSPAAAYITTEIGNAGRVAGMFYDRFGREGRTRLG